MPFPRRQLLRIASFAWPGFLLSRNQAGLAAPLEFGSADAKQTEKVTGIGGFFFRAHDPEALGRWYQEHLGVLLIPTSSGQSAWRQQAGPTAFGPFPQASGYFGDPQKVWMINFRVNDLDKMAAQLIAAGIEIKVDAKAYPNGRFARLHDPEGNPIELWQPGGVAVTN